MSSQASYWELFKKQFTPSKITFHILFWAFHWGIFAYGW
jgi:NADPH oxidase